ncbi:MAG: hypothetical protein ACR2HV_03825, partial [Acidimicrobiales bacterium]
MDLDEVVVGVVSPNLAQKLVFGHHPCAVPYEHAEHLELGGRERDRRAAPGHGILAIVWGGRERQQNSKARTGFICGIIGTSLSALWTLI